MNGQDYLKKFTEGPLENRLRAMIDEMGGPIGASCLQQSLRGARIKALTDAIAIIKTVKDAKPTLWDH